MEETYLIKMLVIVISVMLLVSPIHVIAINLNERQIIKEKSIHVSFTKMLSKEANILSINNSVATYTRYLGGPILPSYTKVLILPLGSKILRINYTLGKIVEDNVSEKIQFASNPIPISIKSRGIASLINEKMNLDFESYPDKWIEYRIGCGIYNSKRATFVILKCYPIRYFPKKNTIYRLDGLDINILYDDSNHLESSNVYDMIIIAPKLFTRALEPLIRHKNEHGLKTIIKTTESIYRESRDRKYDAVGRDNAEKIKYFIKWAIEHWGIKYVLLVGGRIDQQFKWYVPVRYTHLDDGWELGFLSDLYFADIYKYDNLTGYSFEDWDSNGNGIFAEWNLYDHDEIDLFPDVYIGRLACRNLWEVKTVIKKIINYENNAFGNEWFKKMILVGGDSIPDMDNYYEGEIETGRAAYYMESLNFSIVKLWASSGELSDPYAIIDAITNGSGFVFFSGHGNPATWSTHPPRNEEEWVYGISIWDTKLLKNKEKLPVCVIGGCHNNQFDVTRRNFIRGFIREGLRYFLFNFTIDQGSFWKGEWVHNCLGWSLVKQRQGGSIATIANTGIGYGVNGSDCLVGLEGWINTRFFYNYANYSKGGICTIGEIHAKTISDYIEAFSGDWEWTDSKTVEEWELLGDPSLVIGGYPK